MWYTVSTSKSSTIFFTGYLVKNSSFVENFEPADIRDAVFSDGSTSCLENNLKTLKVSVVHTYNNVLYKSM